MDTSFIADNPSLLSKESTDNRANRYTTLQSIHSVLVLTSHNDDSPSDYWLISEMSLSTDRQKLLVPLVKDVPWLVSLSVCLFLLII